jgi:Icc-related predicted phosphoesterase
MDLVFFGDTHELHREVKIPPGDVLICTGDFTMFSKSLRAIQDFDDWLGEQPHRCKLVVPGNHEFFLEADLRRRSLLSNALVLIDESVTIEGLRFYGSPMTPIYGGAFGKSSGPERKRHWAKIDDDTHILVTHGPPRGILDLTPGQQERIGDPELRSRVRELQSLRLHVFGHVHGAYGTVANDGVTFANVALMGHLGELVHEPLVMRMMLGKV